MVKDKDNNTETNILDAAKRIFQRKGLFGARMQEIANEAGINKAMLHYYYRSKQLLFEAVFSQAFNLMAPKLNKIINSDLPLKEKIENFSLHYIDFVIKHPYLPNFIIQELNSNPEFVKTLASKEVFPNIDQFKNQVEELVEKGEIRAIDSKQLFMNIMALCVFPFIGKPLLKGFTQSSEEEYKELMEQRKTEVAEFIINAITIK